MKSYSKGAPENHQLYTSRLEKWVVFFLVFVGTLAVTYGILFVVDFLPEKPVSSGDVVDTQVTRISDTNTHLSQLERASIEVLDPTPSVIIFDSLGKQLPVLNPTTRNVEVLDRALLSGVVRYPDSADFKDVGTIFLFAHSSYLPKVINKNFQAFNGIQNLKWGDVIRLRSSEIEYVYRIDQVYEAKASEVEVPIERGEPRLVLSTCNTFGAKDDRYVVEATLIDSYLF